MMDYLSCRFYSNAPDGEGALSLPYCNFTRSFGFVTPVDGGLWVDSYQALGWQAEAPGNGVL
jgi:hypothetical protein